MNVSGQWQLPQQSIVAISLLTTYRSQQAGISPSAPWHSSDALIKAIWTAAAACSGHTDCCLGQCKVKSRHTEREKLSWALQAQLGHCKVKVGTQSEKSSARPCRHSQAQGQLTASRPTPPGRPRQATVHSNALVHMQQHTGLSEEGSTPESYCPSQASSLFPTALLLKLFDKPCGQENTEVLVEPLIAAAQPRLTAS